MEGDGEGEGTHDATIIPFSVCVSVYVGENDAHCIAQFFINSSKVTHTVV